MISSSSDVSRCLQSLIPPSLFSLSTSSALLLRALRASIPHTIPPKTNENDSSLTSVTSSESTSLSIYSLTVLIFSIESFFSSSLRSVAVSICFSADVFSLPVSLKQRGKRRVGLAVASSLRLSTSHDVKKKKKVTCFFTSSRMERRLHSSSQSCWR